MKIHNNPNINTYRLNFCALDRYRMSIWRAANKLPEYINASYVGYTGAKNKHFPLTKDLKCAPDITKDLIEFEKTIFQEIRETKKKPFGTIRALWKMCQNLGTGEAWDTKFLKEFPGRDINGNIQYAKYKGEIVTGNDISNICFGHLCKFMKIPESLALIIAKLDACGILEPFSKGKFPDIKLLKFRDPPSDQRAISKGIKEFNLKNYNLPL